MDDRLCAGLTIVHARRIPMQTALLEMCNTVATTSAKKRSAPLDPQAADRLLDLLSSDDSFRKLFMSNPREALAQVGFVNETELPSPHFCFGGISKLSPKPVIAAARSEIRNMLTSGLGQISPLLDAGTTARRTLR
jgi:putative modified peptide